MNFKGLEDWFEIFKTGTHTDSEGRTRTWGDSDLEHIVESYDPSKHEAPIVIGHPEINAPAYGWVEKLKKEGEFLYAKAKDLVPEFVDMVKRGLFKKRSISLNPDDSLNHIGFLGAKAPAVKGLADIAFEHKDALIIEFAATEEDKEAQRKRSGKYGIGVKEGGNVTKPSEWKSVPDDQFLDPVNYRYPCPNANQTKAAASYWGMPKNKAQYTPEERSILDRRLDTFRKKFKIGEYRKEGTNMSFKDSIKGLLGSLGVDMTKVPDDAWPEDDDTKSFSEAEVKAREKTAADVAAKKAKDDAKKEFAESQKNERIERRKGEIKGLFEGLKKEGKMLPAWEKMGIVEFALGLDSEEKVEFAEGTKLSPSAWFEGFLKELPKVVNFEEIAKRDKDTGAGNAADKLTILIQKKMATDKDLSYTKAFAEVQLEHPELAAEYAKEVRGEA